MLGIEQRSAITVQVVRFMLIYLADNKTVAKSWKSGSNFFFGLGIIIMKNLFFSTFLSHNLQFWENLLDFQVLYISISYHTRQNISIFSNVLRIQCIKDIDNHSTGLCLVFLSQDDLARENSERIVVAEAGQRTRAEASAAAKKTSVRAQAENTRAHTRQPAPAVRNKPAVKRETVSRII